MAAGQSVTFDVALTLAGIARSVTVSAGTVENAYRVDNVQAGGPLGATPIQDIPNSVNVISRQLIDDIILVWPVPCIGPSLDLALYLSCTEIGYRPGAVGCRGSWPVVSSFSDII